MQLRNWKIRIFGNLFCVILLITIWVNEELDFWFNFDIFLNIFSIDICLISRPWTNLTTSLDFYLPAFQFSVYSEIPR